MKTDGVSAVANDSMPIAGFFVEPVGHSVRSVVQGEKPFVHQAGCFGFKNPSVLKLSILRVRDYEPSHIGCSTGQAARRKWIHCLERLGRVGPRLVTIR